MQRRIMADVTEEILIARMEERFREGDYSEELAEFFERGDDELELPMFARGLKKRPGPRARRQREGRPTERSEATRHPDLAPPANRGVTLYTNIGLDSNQPATHQDVTASPLIMGGYDGGVEIGFTGIWHSDSFESVKPLLEEGLKEAQIKRGGKRFLHWGGRQFKIQPFGGGKGVHYRYIIEGAGMKIYIHNNPDGNLQPIRIRYGAEALIGRSLFSVHEHFRNWLDTVGFEVEKEIVSRTDLQVMIEKPVMDFFRLINSNRLMTKAGKWNTHGRYKKAETFALGSDIEICIYDKGEETLKQMTSNPVKFMLMITCCFGEDWLVNRRPVTRVEFRLRRDALKAKGVDTVRDLQEIEPTLVEWLTTRWFRLLKDKKRRGRENRQEVAPIWWEVQERFREYFPGVDGVRREIIPLRKRPFSCSADQLLKQASGCMASALAILHGKQSDAKQSGELAADLMRSLAEHIHQRSTERATEMEIAREWTSE